jgi:hypothetical protein
MTDEQKTAEETVEQQEAPPAVEVGDGEKITYDQLEEFFIEEGQWLEGQIAEEQQTHQSCPLCSGLPNVFRMLIQAARDALENADSMMEKGYSEQRVIGQLLREKVWYETIKGVINEMFQIGHKPGAIMNAHPELAISKGKRRQIRSGKHKRKMAREARRKNRS